MLGERAPEGVGDGPTSTVCPMLLLGSCPSDFTPQSQTLSCLLLYGKLHLHLHRGLSRSLGASNLTCVYWTLHAVSVCVGVSDLMLPSTQNGSVPVAALCASYHTLSPRIQDLPSLALGLSLTFAFAVTHAPSQPGSAMSSPKVAPRSPRGRTAGGHGVKAIDMDVKGTKLTFYPPDAYNDNIINTDPPQLRLKLEWV